MTLGLGPHPEGLTPGVEKEQRKDSPSDRLETSGPPSETFGPRTGLGLDLEQLEQRLRTSSHTRK